MADSPINLNRVRKQRDRAVAKVKAEANAVKFGRSKGERQRDADQTAREDRHLDGHRKDPPE